MMMISQFGAKTLQKPIKYITTAYTYNETLTFDGSFEPAFILDIVSAVP
jgi:phenylpyruvate tautomerase